MPEVPKLWGASSLEGGASYFYEEHIYHERSMGSRSNIYFGRHFALLKYFTYQSVPVLAPNSKQHICRRLNLENYAILWPDFMSNLFI
jgi:hypothetical protein